ncbi:MAG: prephenate dehydratase [Litorimonas sp.]
MTQKIVYQGEPGAYSHLACSQFYPDHEPLACQSFAKAFAQVRSGEAHCAMIPVENTVAGRVSDIYHLLPEGGLHIIGERYLPVHHQLLGVKGAALSDIRSARSHHMALGQVRKFLAEHGIDAIADVDTAGAARKVAAGNDTSVAAVASRLSAVTYGLDILAEDIEDASHNTTRFIVLADAPIIPEIDVPSVSSFVFKVRSVPSALYKALGGFASNGLNLTKLESYMVGGSFTAAQFYADVEGHIDSPAMKNALEELAFFSENITHLGTYPMDDMRLAKA